MVNFNQLLNTTSTPLSKEIIQDIKKTSLHGFTKKICRSLHGIVS